MDVVGGTRPLLPATAWREWWQQRAGQDDLAALASQQGFVLRAATLSELGVTRSRTRWAVNRGDWTQVRRGVVAPIDLRLDLPDTGSKYALARRHHALLGAAAVMLHPSDAMSVRTAAIVHGLPTMSVPDVPVLNARDEGGMGRRPAAHLLAGTLDRWQMTTWFGVDVSDVARTLVDLARRSRRDAVMAADAALREQLVSADEIDRALQLAYRWPGMRQAREVLALADARSESPLESITRLAMHDACLPSPELQVCIGDDRVDFYWPERRFVLEADGRLKYTADERWAEKQREQRIRRRRNRVERVTWTDVVHDWPATLALLSSALT